MEKILFNITLGVLFAISIGLAAWALWTLIILPLLYLFGFQKRPNEVDEDFPTK